MKNTQYVFHLVQSSWSSPVLWMPVVQQTSEMAQRVKGPSTKPGDLGWSPGPTRWKENCFLHPLMSTHALREALSPALCVHKIKKNTNGLLLVIVKLCPHTKSSGYASLLCCGACAPRCWISVAVMQHEVCQCQHLPLSSVPSFSVVQVLCNFPVLT